MSKKSDRQEAEATPHKGTPPQAYLEARDRLITGRKRRPWNFREHMKKTDEGHWVTYEGQRIAVADMEDSHLVNTVKLLRRHARRAHLVECLLLLAGPRPQGDMATLAFEEMVSDLGSMDSERFLLEHVPPYRAMLARYEECHKRILDKLDECLLDPWGNS